ncbi:MAG TPA: hypothetical protein DEA55_02410 [Rhodospirillaceae bacterium]|nr:hypothetical protein [Rhodospirillaceae bacterium]
MASGDTKDAGKILRHSRDIGSVLEAIEATKDHALYIDTKAGDVLRAIDDLIDALNENTLETKKQPNKESIINASLVAALGTIRVQRSKLTPEVNDKIVTRLCALINDKNADTTTKQNSVYALRCTQTETWGQKNMICVTLLGARSQINQSMPDHAALNNTLIKSFFSYVNYDPQEKANPVRQPEEAQPPHLF